MNISYTNFISMPVILRVNSAETLIFGEERDDSEAMPKRSHVFHMPEMWVLNTSTKLGHLYSDGRLSAVFFI